jgi:hypothetical protein
MMASDRYEQRAEARRELQRFEDRLPSLLETVTPTAAMLAWLMLGDKMWTDLDVVSPTKPNPDNDKPLDPDFQKWIDGLPRHSDMESEKERSDG